MKIVLFFLLSTITMLGQTPLSLNLGGGVALNFNTPLSTVSLPFKIYTNYISPNIIANLTYYKKQSFYNLEGSYHFRRYGLFLELSEEDYYFRFDLRQLTETASLQLTYNHHFWHSTKLKSHFYWQTGAALSFVNHVTITRRIRSSGDFGIVGIDWVGAFEREEFRYTSPSLSTGITLKSELKRLGTIYYGLRYHYDIQPTPFLSSEVNHNGQVHTIHFQTQQHYLMAHLSVGLFDLIKPSPHYKLEGF